MYSATPPKSVLVGIPGLSAHYLALELLSWKTSAHF
jgi:hypothetical protein